MDIHPLVNSICARLTSEASSTDQYPHRLSGKFGDISYLEVSSEWMGGC